MNKLRKMLLTLLILGVSTVFLGVWGVWDPFKKENWEKLGKDIKDEFEKLGQEGGELATRLILKLPEEPKLKGVTVEPTLDTKLHEVARVLFHNAFSSSAHGYGIYRQQDTTMLNQLKSGGPFGLAAFEWDVYVGKGEVRLTHNQPSLDKILRPGYFTEGMKLWEELKYLKKEYFDKNKNAVVFIFLQDVVPDAAMLHKAFDKSGMVSRILKPSEWDPVANRGWPTFRWMSTNNKQLILFSDVKSTEYIYSNYKNVAESDLGVGLEKRERWESRKYDDLVRYLVVFNFFDDPLSKFRGATKSTEAFTAALDKLITWVNDTDFRVVNSTRLQEALNNFIIKGLPVFRYRYPNFIAVDFAAKGNVFGIVDDFNKKAEGMQAVVFRPIITKKDQ